MLIPVFTWLLGLWLLGWAALPASRHLFPTLPDGGLAVGRVLFIAFASLGAFWLASFHLAPLGVSPILFVALAFASLSLLLAPNERCEFLRFVRQNRRALLVSDVVFVVAFLVFGWIRWRNPALDTFEKPMDVALLSAAWRADWLPLENPWLCATPFTGYYIFGPLMAANLARCFGGLPPVAYNLAQPAFCALFVSTLFSLCTALLGSAGRGTLATALVALLGNFEALRQIVAQRAIWPIDGWATSRVIPNTINEYPLFTLVIGDAHAHFFALALEAALMCACWNLMARSKSEATEGSTVEFDRTPFMLLLVCGALLALIAMTNPWNVPLDSLLVATCAFVSMRTRKCSLRRALFWALMPLPLAQLFLWPHLRDFRPAISGASFELWVPAIHWLFLVWGGWLILFAFAFKHAIKEFRAQTEYGRIRPYSLSRLSSRAQFCAVVAMAGIVAAAVPSFVTILGVFQNTSWRHGDTVFKFGLQAWMLGGTAAACGALAAWHRTARTTKLFAAPFIVLFLLAPTLGALGVVWQWIAPDTSRGENSIVALSLDGARHLAADERAAITWLSRNARVGEAVLEATKPGSYSGFGRVSALSGVPTVLGWSQHVEGWGGASGETARRRMLIENFYQAADVEAARAAWKPISALGVKWVFIGELERQTANPPSIAMLRQSGRIAFESGETCVLRIDE